ncbi:alpha/beta fold hydrolase [Streptomyces canus]|uniref:alpha/beta fold hydrolase n=1 Tax=Streptomyces canus TaxID=58343 RepID=UPI003713B7F6
MKRVLKRSLLGFLALFLIFGVWTAATYPLIGRVTYDATASVESRLDGLHTERIDIGEMKMAAYVGGPKDAAETIVLLHGFSADRTVWIRFADHLTDNYRVVIPDLAGHGDTAYKPGWDYSAPAQAARVAALLDKLHIKKANLVGNSMGGFIAANFELAYPDRTSSLTLVDAAGLRAPHPSDMDRMMAQGRNPFQIHNRQEFNTFWDMTMAKPPLAPGFVKAALAKEYEDRRARLADIFADISGPNTLAQHLGDIHVPTLIIWGSKDRILDPSMAEVWHKGISGSKLVVEDDLGHMPMLEAPGQTATDYRDFLDNATR